MVYAREIECGGPPRAQTCKVPAPCLRHLANHAADRSSLQVLPKLILHATVMQLLLVQGQGLEQVFDML